MSTARLTVFDTPVKTWEKGRSGYPIGHRTVENSTEIAEIERRSVGCDALQMEPTLVGLEKR